MREGNEWMATVTVYVRIVTVTVTSLYAYVREGNEWMATVTVYVRKRAGTLK